MKKLSRIVLEYVAALSLVGTIVALSKGAYDQNKKSAAERHSPSKLVPIGDIDRNGINDFMTSNNADYRTIFLGQEDGNYLTIDEVAQSKRDYSEQELKAWRDSVKQNLESIKQDPESITNIKNQYRGERE